jgi:hypothetical protein
MSTAVSVDLTAFCPVELEWGHFSIFRQDVREIYCLAIHLCRKDIRSNRQAESRESRPNGLAGWNIPTVAIFERNFHDLHDAIER